MKRGQKLIAGAAAAVLLAALGGCSSMGVGIGVGGSSGAVSGGVFSTGSSGGGVTVGGGVQRRF